MVYPSSGIIFSTTTAGILSTPHVRTFRYKELILDLSGVVQDNQFFFMLVIRLIVSTFLIVN